MWRKGDLFKPRTRSWEDRRLLLEAIVWLGLLRAALMLLLYRRIIRLLGMTGGEGPEALNPDLADRAARVGWAVGVAAPSSHITRLFTMTLPIPVANF